MKVDPNEQMRDARIACPMGSERHQTRTLATRAVDRAMKLISPETLRTLYALSLINDRSEVAMRIQPVSEFYGADPHIVAAAFGFHSKRQPNGVLSVWTDSIDRLKFPPILPLDELQAASVVAWAFSHWEPIRQ